MPELPELMEETIKKKKEKMLEGRNERIMSPAEESQKKMRKLEERLEKAEEEIEEIKEFLLQKEKVPPELNLCKFYLIEMANNWETKEWRNS